MSKILESIKNLKGKPSEIPDVGRNDLPEFFVEMGYKTIVEIGVYRADFTEVLAKSGLQIYGVDPWLAYTGYPYNSDPKTQQRMDEYYKLSLKKMAYYPNCTILKESSMEAVKHFEDSSLDGVYIDGNHSFRYIAEDLCEWSKKVKKGGIIAGHDYIYGNPVHFHVRFVLEAYIEAFGIKNFWVLGRKHPDEGEMRDEWRSWMFFNK